MIEQINSLSYEDIKSKYGAYLESLDISKNTRYTACTDAFYLWRKRGKEAFSLKQIDQYIWQLGKEFFPKKY